MFYIHKAGPPSPAEPLYSAHVVERKRWLKDYDRHQHAVTHMKGLVDQKKPRCHDYQVIKTLENTRRAVELQKQAFIARENSKLADRIHQIYTGERYRSVAALRKLVEKPSSPMTSASTDTLHSTLRKRVALDVRRENSFMVKRILKVKTSPDVRRGLQEKHFALHEKYKVLMAKIHPITMSSAKPSKKSDRLPPVKTKEGGGAGKEDSDLSPVMDYYLIQDTGDHKKKKDKTKPLSVRIAVEPTLNEDDKSFREMVKETICNVILVSMENMTRHQRSADNATE